MLFEIISCYWSIQTRIFFFSANWRRKTSFR